MWFALTLFIKQWRVHKFSDVGLSNHVPITNIYSTHQVPQWKEKAKQQQNYSFGLIAYPLLMAADILLYRASYVPVGADQIQQLQLCR